MVPETSASLRDLSRVTLTGMLSELSEQQLETRSTEAVSLYLKKSNIWDILSSYEGKKKEKKIMLSRK